MKQSQLWRMGLCCLAAACLLVSAAEAAAEAPAGNLIKNGNFADGLKCWTRQGTGAADIKVDGGRLFFQKKDDAYAVINQDVDITSFGAYSIEVSADNRNMLGSQVVIIPFANGKFGDWRTISYVRLQPVDGIQQVSQLISLGSDVTKVRISICGNKTGTNFLSVLLKKSFAREAQKVPAAAVPPKLDGNLDEPFWKNALALSGFRVLGEPTTPAKVGTKALAATSGDYLYVAYEADEPEMDKLTLVKKNTAGLYVGDDVEFLVSPDREQFYQFLANADGFKGALQKQKKIQKLHATWYDEPEDANEFSGEWQVAARKMDNKYVVEMAIKLRDIIGGKPVTNPDIYMNFCRHRTLGDAGQAYTNWAGLVGKTFHAPKDFPEFKLSWKNSGTVDGSVKTAATVTPLVRITEPLTLPSTLIVGKPVKMIVGEGLFALPASLKFNDVAFAIDDGVKKLISLGVAGVKGGGEASIEIAGWDENLLPPLNQEEAARCASPEAFILAVSPGTVKINARSREGTLRALATLALLGSQAKSSKSRVLQCFAMVDGPWFKIRGWDAGGIREPDSLKKLVDLYFLLRLNYLQFEVSTYSQYAAFPFASHPNIGQSKFTKKDFSDLADHARARGITLVPLFYSWSRAGFIFNKPEYENMAATRKPGVNQNPHGVYNRNSNAFNPETEKLILDLYDELIDTMKLTHLNLGLDEVHFGAIVDSDAPNSKGKTNLDWFKTVIAKSRDHLVAREVTMWMFADELSPFHNGPANGINDANKDDAKLVSLPKDVVMMPWHYQIPSTGRYDAVTFFKQAGFPVVGTPCWYRINNVPTFIHDLRYFKGNGILGTTWGNPMPDTKDTVAELFSAISMLAYLAWSPENCELPEFPFVSSAFYQHVAFRYGRELPYADKCVTLALPETSVACHVKTLKMEIGFPEYMQPDFLKKPFTTLRGITITPFSRNGDVAAIAVHGGAGDTVVIPIGQKIQRLTFMHAVNKIYGYDGREISKYAKTVPGIYELTYEDGTKAALSLKLRTDVNEWNDGILAKKCEPGIYGSMERKLHVNIPLYTWNNPYPDKAVKSLAVRSGNSKDINLYLFGASLE